MKKYTLAKQPEKMSMPVQEALAIGVKMMLTIETCHSEDPLRELVFVIEIPGVGFGLYGFDHGRKDIVCDTVIDCPSLYEAGCSLGELVFSVAKNTYVDARNIKVFAERPEDCIYQG